jgi:hypothetical protein
MAAIAVPTAVSVAIRSDGVAWTPSTVVVAIGFVIPTDVSYADAAVDTFNRATCQRRHAQPADAHLHQRSTI